LLNKKKKGEMKVKVQQFNDNGCLSYVVYCSETRETVIIDPTHPPDVYEKLIVEKKLQVNYIIETHTHADHISTARETAAAFQSKIVMHENISKRDKVQVPPNIPESIVNIVKYNSQIPVDILVDESQTLPLGQEQIKFIPTPGHTVDGMCVGIKHLLFTGDTLLIGQCGRTDLPGGNSQELYPSLFERLSQFPDDIVIYPAHDYQEGINTVLGYERVNNPCLVKRDLQEFVQFISKFFPPLEDNDGGKLQCSIAPKATVAASAASAASAEQQASPLMNEFCFHMEQYLRAAPFDWNGITCHELKTMIDREKDLFIIDVRQPEELQDTGYIAGAINIPLRQLPGSLEQVPQNKEQSLVVVCRSGSRSAYGALYLRGYGYTNVKNLDEGMIGWLKNNYPVVRMA
jgi:glyoxylase-like metal-dependent hydrolase (beta-lactamase superfamily II)/rhodanese-related sulfurtransferase